jgi:hypothetical protein
LLKGAPESPSTQQAPLQADNLQAKWASKTLSVITTLSIIYIFCNYLGTYKSNTKFLFLVTKFPDAIENLKRLRSRFLATCFCYKAFQHATRSKSFCSLTSRDEDERYRKTSGKQGMNVLQTLLDINYKKQALLKYT